MDMKLLFRMNNALDVGDLVQAWYVRRGRYFAPLIWRL